MNRIDRLLGIITFLQSNKNISVDLIAEKYDISIRTVYRDLKALDEIGIPITYDANRGYYIIGGFFLPPLHLTKDEANALILISSLSKIFADSQTEKNVENAINKIKSVLQYTDQEIVNKFHSQIKINSKNALFESKNLLIEIQNSIINEYILRIEYINNKNKTSRREIESIGLTFYSNQWHLIAWCWKRKAYRDFKLKKISSVISIGEKFRKDNHFNINEYINSII